jgi:hypothetical protein
MELDDELIPPLEELYQRMDAAYEAIAQQSGFSCRDCDGATCCTVDLTVHTAVERLFLTRGINALDKARRSQLTDRCRRMLEAKTRDPEGPEYRNTVCVLNENGLCALYSFRPMICRLAGIRHVIVRPDGSRLQGPGCPRFTREIEPQHPHLVLDRTTLYQQLAALEIRAARRAGSRTPPATISRIAGEVLLGDDAPGACPGRRAVVRSHS